MEVNCLENISMTVGTLKLNNKGCFDTSNCWVCHELVGPGHRVKIEFPHITKELELIYCPRCGRQIE
jgi:hypothetical protein